MLVQHNNTIDELDTNIDSLKLQLTEINDTHKSNVVEIKELNKTNSTNFSEIVKQQSFG